jgi:hypothetical protein
VSQLIIHLSPGILSGAIKTAREPEKHLLLPHSKRHFERVFSEKLSMAFKMYPIFTKNKLFRTF